jgi:hypothetical protein
MLLPKSVLHPTTPFWRDASAAGPRTTMDENLPTDSGRLVSVIFKGALFMARTIWGCCSDRTALQSRRKRFDQAAVIRGCCGVCISTQSW